MTAYVWIAQRSGLRDDFVVYGSLLAAQTREDRLAGFGIDWRCRSSDEDVYVGHAIGYSVRLIRRPFFADGDAP